MKYLLFSVLFLFLCLITAEAQTNANAPGPENVFVVWNSNVSSSDSVKDYYKNVRNIPTSNILDLALPNSVPITINGVTHPVIIAENGNIIRDSVNDANGTWFATEHAWKYFYQYVAAPIKDHITSNNLTSIRYIVLCKGTPFYIQAACDSTNVIANLAVDGLLAMLGTNNYENLLNSIYNKYRSYAISGSQYYYSSQPQITNPYYNVDPNLNMNYRFKPSVYTRNWNGHTIKLDYLVSHLDGISYDIVENMIDLSISAINSDNYDWFIDADPTPCHGLSIMVNFANSTASKLNSIGFTNYSFNTNEDTVTYHNKPVMSYSSNGVHTTKPPNTIEGQTLHPDYIQSQLNFNYAPGAIFNTAESFNCYLLSTISRITQMGQVVDFFVKGGTLGVGHAYEPYIDGIVKDGIMFPSYQVGYSFIDAAYMGMYYLAWQNVFVGDPLTTIAWGKQELTENLTWRGSNLVTGEVTIPEEDSITLSDDATVKLKHTGFITGDGYVITQGDFDIEVYDWEKAVFRSAYNNHPKIIWGAYPTEPLVDSYKIYRKYSTQNYQLVGTVNENTFQFVDNSYNIIDPIISTPKNIKYYVQAMLQVGPDTIGSDPSNVIDYWVEKARKINITKNETPYEYNLNQNYPNPFNPSTTIKYNLKDEGLVSLKVYNILGSEIAELVNEQKSAGEHSVTFDFSALGGLASGTYFYVIRINDFVDVKKMVLLK